jgi:hypothetical protein
LLSPLFVGIRKGVTFLSGAIYALEEAFNTNLLLNVRSLSPRFHIAFAVICYFYFSYRLYSSAYLPVHFLISKSTEVHWTWWCMPITSAFGRLRQEDHKLEASLSYIV